MPDAVFSPSLLNPVFSSAAMRAIVADRARLQGMLDVLAALARAEAAVGVIPTDAAMTIADACKAEHFDLAALTTALPSSGDPARLVREALAAEIAKTKPDASQFVGWGAASQDIVDTAMVLALRAGLDALLFDLDRAVPALLTVTGRYRRTPTVARIALRHVLPVPFGLKFAGHAAALARSRERLKRLRKDALALQFGGPAGTLASLDERGLDVAERLSALIDLPLPEAPWHGHRDRVAEIGTGLAVLAGTCGTIGRDVALLMQTEIAEANDPAASDNSEPAPHVPLAVSAAAAMHCAAIAPSLAATVFAAQASDRDGGAASLTEWLGVSTLLLAASGALAAIADIASHIAIDAERMRDNVESSPSAMAEGVEAALARKLGRAEARAAVADAVQKAAAEARDFQSVLAEDPRVTAHFTPEALMSVFEPLTYQGVSQLFIDRLVASSLGRTYRRAPRDLRTPTFGDANAVHRS